MVVHVHMFSFLPSQRRATTGALPAAVRPSLWADPTSPSPPLHTVSLCTIRTDISALAHSTIVYNTYTSGHCDKSLGDFRAIARSGIARKFSRFNFRENS